MYGVSHIDMFPDFVPECIYSLLRICTISDYEGREDEMRLAKYIMQNSRSLETIKIRCKSSLNPGDKFEMLKHLSLCPRMSKTCKLEFIE
jgi:hypothetical protein